MTTLTSGACFHILVMQVQHKFQPSSLFNLPFYSDLLPLLVSAINHAFSSSTLMVNFYIYFTVQYLSLYRESIVV